MGALFSSITMGAFFSSRFDPLTDIPSLKGKVIIVTGGNTGIGYTTIKHLARRGAKVYMASRNESKATAAIASLEAEGLGPDHGQVLWHPLDLSDPRTAKKSAQEFLKQEARLDVLINNAALTPLAETSYGETCGASNIMVVNHISPFVFTQHLLSLLKKTAEEPDSDVRIVNLTSFGHRFVSAGTRFKSTQDFKREFADVYLPSFPRYFLSKLANILWTNELQNRLTADGMPIIAISVHPGAVNTLEERLTRFRTFFTIFLRIFFRPWDEGAYNSVIAAASPAVRQDPEKYMGGYIEDHYGKLKKPSKDAQDPEAAAELWAVTEDFLRSIGVN